MKCLVFSDSHGDADGMRRVIAMHKDADVIFFLGDGLRDFEEAAYRSPAAKYFVRGNCDFSHVCFDRIAERTEEITLDGKKILICHGDLFGVKGGCDRLLYYARERECDIVLFGHTHVPTEEWCEVSGRRIALFNPGSISRPAVGERPSFGIITVDSGSVLMSHGSV